MAEIFSTVAGALSVAALFDNCVNCFEYIQLGRHFGQDYERCRLKLDIAQARLSRWGTAVAINDDPRFATASPADAMTQRVQSILEEIGLLYRLAQKTSKRYELGATTEDLVLYQEEDMQPVFRRLHGHLGRVVRQRQKQTSLAKKVTWALYEGRYFDRLIKEITGFVDDLETIYPVEAARRQLAQLEIERIVDEPSLKAISNAAAGIDDVLAEVAARKIVIKNYAGRVDAQEKARVRVGNEFADAVFGHGVGITDETTNTAGRVDAKGDSAVHIGNKYGGRGIFD
ncbi:Prion-inhibition and propagation domain-containing protein [Pleurostoma richardsiae]|uniref:Prion-inhibition and propagation domain-containing protein n=1 Tax=Pleurostoma richardsiae TaxID=41990 RepID=A0AA38VVV7_9PEZI|nr:Prion-inhibition and propagation domain-containing protein [Pleurostoma richardsiae]